MERKIIACGEYWDCANMDTLAPITEVGMEYLLSDDSRILIKNSDKTSNAYNLIKSLDWANEGEQKLYVSTHYNIIFKGDKVVIARGRKMKGEEKIVNGYCRYEVPGTYGKIYTDYLFFTDGTKVNILHCDVVGVDYTNNFYDKDGYVYRRYKKDFRNFDIPVGGRL